MKDFCGKKKAITFSYDDGVTQDERLISLFNKYGLKCTFNLNSGFLVFRVAIHSGCGFLCLWLLNTVSGFTGIAFPINAATVLIAGTLGLPGIGLLTILAVWA